MMPLVAGAQGTESKLSTQNVKVRNLKTEKTDKTLLLGMDINLDSLDLRANHVLVLTPVLKGVDREEALPQVVINGRKADITYRRRGMKGYAEDATILRRKNDTEQTVPYTAVVPYSDWMRNSDLVLVMDDCGCGDPLGSDVTPLKKFRSPLMPYLKPKAEKQKERQEEGRAFIDFPVNKTELHPDYRKNPRELRKIIETINLVKTDKNTTITNINIHGYASPESPYTHNAYLAENRAKTLKDYVRNLVSIPDSKFSVSFTPEDWEGLRDSVEKSELAHRSEILALIDNDKLDPDSKEKQIKSAYPEEYRFMLNTWYPALRHSDYMVKYTVRPFSVEEAKEIFKTKPQQLSLEEMFMVAQTYEPGSPAFNEVMETAARMHPADNTANLNAACARMEAGDYEGARRYLAKAGDSADVLHAKGVLAMLEGDTAKARDLLTKAKNAGAARAEENLNLLNL